jgi:hypothetical protein
MRKIIVFTILAFYIEARGQSSYVVTAPALHNNWDYASSQNASTYAAQAAATPINQAIQNSINNRNQMLLNQENNDYALKMQREQIQAAAARQKIQTETELKLESMAEDAQRLQQEQLIESNNKKNAVVSNAIKQIDEANRSKIQSGISAIENP